MIPNDAKDIIKTELISVIYTLEESIIALQGSLVNVGDVTLTDRVAGYLKIIEKQKNLYYELEELLAQDADSDAVWRHSALIMQLCYLVKDDAALLAIELSTGEAPKIPENLLN